MNKIKTLIQSHKLITSILIFLVLVFFSFIIPLIINQLHSCKNGISVEWSVSDYLLFYGSFLAFLGTTFLGLVTVIQSKQVITNSEKANEINTINKIISIQAERVDKIEESIEKLTEITKPQVIAGTILSNWRGEDLSSENFAELWIVLQNKKSEVMLQFLKVTRIIKAHTVKVNVDFENKLSQLQKDTEEHIEHYFAILRNDKKEIMAPSKQKLSQYYNNYNLFLEKKEDFYQDITNKLNEIIICKDVSLSKVKEVYPHFFENN